MTIRRIAEVGQAAAVLVIELCIWQIDVEVPRLVPYLSLVAFRFLSETLKRGLGRSRPEKKEQEKG